MKRLILQRNDSEYISCLKSKKPAKGLILEFVSLHPGVSRSELKELFGNFSPHIKWLTENNLAQVEFKEISRDPFKNVVSEIRKT